MELFLGKYIGVILSSHEQHITKQVNINSYTYPMYFALQSVTKSLNSI